MSTEAQSSSGAEDSLTSSPADFRVSSVPHSTMWIDAASGLKMNPQTAAASSGKCSELSRKQNRVGFCLRTYLVFELQAQTTFSFHWSERATPAGRSWWVLHTSAPLTGECAFGLPDAGSTMSTSLLDSSAEPWPTPKSSSSREGQEDYGRTLSQAVRNWPTPMADPATYNTQENGYGENLRQAVRKWPTPTSSPSSRDKRPDLLQSVRLWPTPNASPAAKGGRPSLPGMPCWSPLLVVAVKNWPTPQAHDKKDTRSSYDNREGLPQSLTASVKIWPTPKDIPHVVLGRRCVRFPLKALRAWLESKTKFRK